MIIDRLHVGALFLMAMLCACGEHRPESPAWVHTATVIEAIPAGQAAAVWLEDEAVRSVWIRRDDAGMALVVDGNAWPTVPAMPVTWSAPGTDVVVPGSGPAWFASPEGHAVAHVAQVEGGVAYIVGRVPGPTFDELWPLVFNHDGTHHAYLARRGEQRMVVLDGAVHAEVAGVRGRLVDGWPALRFAPRGDALGFVESDRTAEGKTRQRVWFAGLPGPWFADVRYLVISPDGQDHAYRATGPQDRLQRVVRGGVVGPAFQSVGRMTFSSDGKHLAYYARTNDMSGLFIDNVPQAHGMIDIVGPPVFSPDGERVLFVESAEGGWRVVAGEHRGKTYPRVVGPRFMPDGRTPLYLAGDDDGLGWVRGADEGPRTPTPRAMAFSPDGRRSAMVLVRGGVLTLIVDGTSQPLDATDAGEPLFSPDGRSVACRARRADGTRMVIDGEAGPTFDALATPGGPRAMALRGHERFVDPDTLRYLARQRDRVVVVDARRR